MRKLLLFFVAIIIGLVGCVQPEQYQEQSMPEDLPELKNFRKEKVRQIKSLESELLEIEAKIQELDPNSIKAKPLVTVSKLQKKNLEHFVVLQGAVQAVDLRVASSETGGRIVALYVKEGDYVKKGKLIAKIDLETLHKQIAEVEKSLELANDVYEKQSRLWEQKIGSELQYLQAKNNKERLEKTIESISFQLSKSNVYAPISGTVERVFNKSGEMAGPGSPIIQILDTRKLKAVVDVPENFLRSVKRGKMVELYYPAVEIEDKGKISNIGRVIDPTNRTFKVEINIKDATGYVKPNLLVEMKLNDFTIEDAVVLPLYIVQEEVGGKKFVYISQDSVDGKIAKKVYVTVGNEADGEVVVEDGLMGNEELIMEGAFSIADSELIEVLENEVTDAE